MGTIGNIFKKLFFYSRINGWGRSFIHIVSFQYWQKNLSRQHLSYLHWKYERNFEFDTGGIYRCGTGGEASSNAQKKVPVCKLCPHARRRPAYKILPESTYYQWLYCWNITQTASLQGRSLAEADVITEGHVVSLDGKVVAPAACVLEVSAVSGRDLLVPVWPLTSFRYLVMSASMVDML